MSIRAYKVLDIKTKQGEADAGEGRPDHPVHLRRIDVLPDPLHRGKVRDGGRGSLIGGASGEEIVGRLYVAIIWLFLFGLTGSSVYQPPVPQDPHVETEQERIDRFAISLLPRRDRGLVLELCRSLNMRLSLAAALASHESDVCGYAVGFNPDGSYDSGLLQINSGNLPLFSRLYLDGAPFDPYDETQNLIGGLKHLADLIAHDARGNVRVALRIYNAGPRCLKTDKGSAYATMVLDIEKEIISSARLSYHDRYLHS